jgi:hypothetical protein
MDEGFGIACGGEDGSFLDEVASDFESVCEISVVCDGTSTEFHFCEEGLDIVEGGSSGGGVSVVADGGSSFEGANDVWIGEGIADTAFGSMGVEVGFLVADDSGGFLPSMLESVESEGDVSGGVVAIPYAEDATFFAVDGVALEEEVRTFESLKFACEGLIVRSHEG